MTDFSTAPDYFDSREAIERIEEIETDQLTESGAEEFDSDLLDDETREEYDALLTLREDAAGYVSDWEYGETFIREDEFQDYAEEQLRELGYLPADLPSWIVIDMKATADNMKEDYSEFTFRGVTYLARV